MHVPLTLLLVLFLRSIIAFAIPPLPVESIIPPLPVESTIPPLPVESIIQPLPAKQIGMYLLLSDDTVVNYTSTSIWKPKLHAYQKQGANVLYLTFINPTNMSVPPAYSSLASDLRNLNSNKRPTILFAVGGYSYSIHPNPWPWLVSKEKAVEMAKSVSKWPEMYGCDGIDLDIETGAGDSPGAASNLVVFITELKRLRPEMVVTQPVFGYPQVKAETAVVNAVFRNHSSTNVTAAPIVDAVGIMVYTGINSLTYLKNYVNGSSQWEGFPIHVNVPSTSVVCGMSGGASEHTLNQFVVQANKQNIKGVMVWYASVLDESTNNTAIQYAGGAPDSSNKKTTSMWAKALSALLGE